MRRLLGAAVVVVAAGCARSPQVLHLSTTTSVENTGLLAALLPAFKAETGIEVQAVAVGSGRALAIFERGDADVALVHDPGAEQRVIDAGHVARYRKFMYNDFLIAGPEPDPARLRETTTAVEAMQRLARSRAPFASRGDSSGTHTRELELWKAAGVDPSTANLVDVGQGMAATLRIASERQAYVLTDRATLSQLGQYLRLVILSEGDPAYLNTYAAMVRAGLTGDRRANAERFFTWLTEGAGRAAVSAFRMNGAIAFHVWPAGSPHGRTTDLPHVR
jgi:tungstate transport system substrate-binding protein